MASNQTTPPNTSKTADAEEWFARLGFASDPFGQALGAEFYYTTPSLQQRLDLILHLIEFSNSPIAIVGDEGSGKSALLRAVSRHAPPSWRIFLVADAARTTASSLAHTIADALAMRLPKDSPELELRLVCDRLRAMAGSGVIVAGLIDDASSVPADLLRSLLKVAAESGVESAFRLVLALRGRESEPLTLPFPEGFDAGRIRRIAPPIFSPEQVAAYVEARFAAAGCTGGSPLPAAVIDWICMQAAGNLGRADLLTHRALRSPESVPSGPWFEPDRLRGIVHKVPRAAFVAGGSFLAVALATSFWFSSRSGEGQDAVEQMDEPNARTRSFQLELPTTETPTVVVPEEAQPAALQPIPLQSEPSGVSNISSEPAPLPAFRKLETTAVEALPAETAQTKPPALKHLAAEQESQQRPTSEPVTAPAVAAIKDSTWLLDQPDNGYAIQLLAAFDRAALRRFLRQHGLEQQSIVIEGTRNGRPWFIATLGYFPSRNAASAAIGQLPAAVQRERPWPRTIKELRAAMHP